MINQQEAMSLVPAEPEFIITGVAGETATHWVIRRETIYEPGSDEDQAATLGMLIPVVDKTVGTVSMISGTTLDLLGDVTWL